MKIRLMGTTQQNNQFIQTLKSIPDITIISESKPYPNRGTTVLERVYLEIELNTVYQQDDVVESLLDYHGIFQY